MPIKDAELAKALNGEFQIGMIEAPYKACPKCCFAALCSCCVAHSQREKILDITQEQYVCCGGLCPCGPCSKPCENRQPWLCLETTCCTSNAILGNRYMIQTRFDRQNDACDECLLYCVAIANCLALIVSCFGDEDTAEGFRTAADCIQCSVCACMQAQQAVELEFIERDLETNPYTGIKPNVLELLPPKQQEMIRLNPNAPAMAPPPQYGGMVQGVPVAGGMPAAQGVPVTQ